MKQHYDKNWLIEKFENGEDIKFIYFWGHTNKYKEKVGKFCFSQWFESPFQIDDIIYKTSEHWMMAQKALLFNDKAVHERILNSKKPGEAKELGRQVDGFNEEIWNEKRFEIVKFGNIHKFNQNWDFGEYLLGTENRVLVEASPVDAIWGIGLSVESEYINNIYAWRGLNLLGFALMEVRDILREVGHFKPLDNSLLPPWKKFSNVDSQDMFWRMGKGEEYLMQFCKFYQGLPEREKVIFKLTNPAPSAWENVYE
jgi:ribA/ribD-fused uncharacterized protein